MRDSPLLQVDDLEVQFSTDRGTISAVAGISFSLHKGRTLGIVGESGCGKSVTSLALMRLISHPGRIARGRVTFDNKDLLSLPEKEMRRLRGNQIAMIFQEPMTSLNPVFTVGDQIQEVILLHQDISRREAWAKTVEMLRLVGIPEPERRAGEYPHQLSGGMRQRVMIAMALSCEPQLLIADEPTTALDVTIQAQILELIRSLQKKLNTAMILITHDLGVVAETCDEVAVMYAGKIVEYAPVGDIFRNPQHPYTRGLLDSIPHFETGQRREKLTTIPGMVPSLYNLPMGCRFQERCRFVQSTCRSREPELSTAPSGRRVACHFPIGGPA